MEKPKQKLGSKKKRKEQKAAAAVLEKIRANPDAAEMPYRVYLEAHPEKEQILDMSVGMSTITPYKKLTTTDDRISFKTSSAEFAKELGNDVARQFLAKNPRVPFTVHTKLQKVYIFINSTFVKPGREHTLEAERLKLEDFRAKVQQDHPQIVISAIRSYENETRMRKWHMLISHKDEDVFRLLYPLLKAHRVDYSLITKNGEPILVCNNDIIAKENARIHDIWKKYANPRAIKP